MSITEAAPTTAIQLDPPFMSEPGLAVVRSFEGCALRAYKDSVGVWTIGYGITNYDAWAVQYLGRKIGAGMTITQEQAEYLLVESLRRGYVPAVKKALPGGDQRAVDAGGSFHFNTGAIARATWPKLWRAKADAAQIRASLMSWNKAGGKVLNGLTRRRAREASILLSGDYGPEGRTAPPRLDDKGRIVTESAGAATHFLSGTPGMLKSGDTGPAIADLNAALAKLGYKTSGDAFTMQTEYAVRSVQKAHPQLTVDGVAGPATRAQINRMLQTTGGAKSLTALSAATEAATAVGDAVHGGVPAMVYVAIALGAVALLGAFLWRYRDEVMAFAAKK